MSTRNIYEIFVKELKYIIYSPVGWILLAIFVLQSSQALFSRIGFALLIIGRGAAPDSLSEYIFTDSVGSVYSSVYGSLYLFIPLLTMGVLSREIGSGTIKLLFSSPIQSAAIVIGKYMSVVAFLFIFALYPLLMGLFCLLIIPNFDFLAILPGAMGIVFLASAYAAIGIFVSSLTKHQVVVAIVTLGILYVFLSIANWFASVPFLNEVTHWLSLTRRAAGLQSGLVSTDDVIYFLVIISIFVMFTVIRVSNYRLMQSWSLVAWKAGVAVSIAVAIGMILSLPQFNQYLDFTYNERNSLTIETRELVGQIDGPWGVTTVANIVDRDSNIAWPSQRIRDRQTFDLYANINHNVTRKYFLFYEWSGNPRLRDNLLVNPRISSIEGPPTEEAMIRFYAEYVLGLDPDLLQPVELLQEELSLDLEREQFRTFRLFEANGQTAIVRRFDDFFRVPTEREYAAGFNRLVNGPKTIGFAASHGERSVVRNRPTDYQRVFSRITDRNSLINHGFDLAEVDLSEEVPGRIDILVIADPRVDYDGHQLSNLFEYIERGGDILITVEAESASSIDDVLMRFGLARGARLLQDHPEGYSEDLILVPGSDGPLSALSGEIVQQFPTALDGAVELLSVQSVDGYNQEALLTASHARSLADGLPVAPVDRPVAFEFSRTGPSGMQNVIIFGDADFLSNAASERREPIAHTPTMDLFHHMTEGEIPVKTTEIVARDRDLNITRDQRQALHVLMTFLLPIAILSLGLWILWRRQKQ